MTTDPLAPPEGALLHVLDESGTQVLLSYVPTPQQLEFHQATQPNVMMLGNRGGGKSHALRYDAHMRALSTPDFTYLLVRRKTTDLKKTHLRFIDRELAA